MYITTCHVHQAEAHTYTKPDFMQLKLFPTVTNTADKPAKKPAKRDSKKTIKKACNLDVSLLI